MRKIGTLHPTESAPLPPDTVTIFLLTGGSSAQASDWNTSTGAVANAAAAGVGVVRITMMTTAGAAFYGMANLLSTGAGVPSAGTSVGTTGIGHPVTGQQYFQVPGGSTGFSVAAFTSGYAIVEQWGK